MNFQGIATDELFLPQLREVILQDAVAGMDTAVKRWYYDADGRIVGRQFHEADSVLLIMLDAYRIARSTDGGSGYCCGTHEAPADPAPTEAPVMRRW